MDLPAEIPLGVPALFADLCQPRTCKKTTQKISNMHGKYGAIFVLRFVFTRLECFSIFAVKTIWTNSRETPNQHNAVKYTWNGTEDAAQLIPCPEGPSVVSDLSSFDHHLTIPLSRIKVTVVSDDR